MNKRVIEVIESKNLTPSKFADKIGVPRSTISHIISGRNKPSLELISKISECFPDISLEWLIKGKGTIVKAQASLFDEYTEEKRESNDQQSLELEAKQDNLHLETKDVDNVEYKRGQKSDSGGNELQKEISVKRKTKNEVSSVILVYSDNTFEILKSF